MKRWLQVSTRKRTCNLPEGGERRRRISLADDCHFAISRIPTEPRDELGERPCLNGRWVSCREFICDFEDTRIF